MIEFKGKYTTAKVMIDEIDGVTSGQIHEFINHPAFSNPIAIMPDTHAGKGAVIGFTMELTDKVIPNVIGVDIGCGMLSSNVGKDLFSNMTREEVDTKIRERIPFGSNVRNTVSPLFRFDWKKINEDIRQFTLKFNRRFDMNIAPVVMNDQGLSDLFAKVGCNESRGMKSIGTLGGGNHFIEIGIDGNEDYWVTVHSGSRNFGKCIAEYHQRIAVERITKPKMTKSEYIEYVKSNFEKSEWQSEIARYSDMHKQYIPKGTEYLEGQDMYNYLVDMMVAQNYADISRKVMMIEILDIMGRPDKEYISTVHNFVDFDDWVVRKGAIRSYEGEKMIIPFNMEDGLIIAEGKSNPEWNCSAPHGAGRLFSRSKAKQVLNLDEAKESMKDKDIYTSVVPLDECKGAYKDAEIIEMYIEPTADILLRVKPVLNMKDRG